MRILVAEDDSINAHVIAKVLESLGHEAVLAHDGQEALAAMIADPCPVVISDWMMPGMDGIALCKTIRTLALPFYVYYILLTAKIPQSEGSKVLACGVDAFLPKPLNPEDLRIKLNVAQSVVEHSHVRQIG